MITKEYIRTYYKYLAVLTAIVGVLLILLPIENLPFHEKIFNAIFLNVGYHLFYHSFNKVPLIQLNWLPNNSNLKKYAKKGVLFISYSMIVVSLFMSILLIYDSINTGEYYMLTMILIFIGASFGAINLNLDLKEKE